MQAGAVPAIIALSAGEGVEVALQRRCAAALCNLACTPANITRMVEVGDPSTKPASVASIVAVGYGRGTPTCDVSYLVGECVSYCSKTAIQRRNLQGTCLLVLSFSYSMLYCCLNARTVYHSTGRGDSKHHPPPQDRGHPMRQGGSNKYHCHFLIAVVYGN